MNYDNYTLWTNTKTFDEKLNSPEGNSLFVIFRYSISNPYEINMVSNRWFNEIDKAIAYIKYVLVRLALCGEIFGLESRKPGDIDFDKEFCSLPERQCTEYKSYWDRISAAFDAEDKIQSLKKYADFFNERFSCGSQRFEINIADGIEEYKRISPEFIRHN